ncbi:ribosomal protein L1, partial [Metschnikowia bicuspidata var. bicuspidata NRRL YB-4993]
MARKTRSSTSPKTPAKSTKPTSVDSTPVKSTAVSKSKKALKAQPKAAIQKEFGYVSKSQASKALEELKKFIARSKEISAKEGKEKSDLFADEDDKEENTQLVVRFELKKLYTKKAEFKPKLVALSKPYRNINGKTKTCLFLRDQFITSDEEVENIEKAQIPTLAKILTLTQLKTVYKTFEKRRELQKEYDIFVVDDAILSSMPSTLGKTFYQNTTKFPINVRVASTKSPKELSHQTLTNQINKVLSSSAFLPPVSTDISLTIGAIGPDFSEEELLSNIEQVLKQFPQELLVTVGLQTAGSPVLPLYYAERIYDDADVLENVADKDVENAEAEDVYTKALLELADESTVKQVLGKTMKAHKK